MKMAFVCIKYERDECSDTITISRYSENVDAKGSDYIIDSYSCLASTFDYSLNKYFIATDIECQGGHRFNNISGDKSAFEKMFKEVFSK